MDAGVHAVGLQALAALEEFQRATRPLRGRFLVIKGGILLLLDRGRLMTDLDLVVERGQLQATVACLRAEGWSVARSEQHSIPLLAPRSRFCVDLHVHPLPLGFGRLELAQLFDASVRVPHHDALRLPAPIDAALITLAHYVKDRFGARTHPSTQDDLAFFLDGISAERFAQRATNTGLRRIAAAGALHLWRQRPAQSAWAEALLHSAHERRLLEAWVSLVERLNAHNPALAYWTMRMLADSHWLAARGLALEVRLAIERRVNRRLA